MTTAAVPTPSAAFWFNSMFFEYLPNAGLTPTERDILDILLSRQEPGGIVFITQAKLSERLGVLQPNISKALAGLSERGIIEPPELRRRGRIRLHKFLAAYEGPRQAIAAMHDPNIPDWPLSIPTSETRPARTASTGAAKVSAASEAQGPSPSGSGATARSKSALKAGERRAAGRPRLRVV
ncbi:helix-turn-helix transcriptional regulator [Kitasatospora sp. NPDC057223]|uniref:helix-turn-helix transcriptional regulator n=1 Tax=Kitasatospora sp. NPDC057223 TaxID=3346055 RepID=UPI003633B550